MHAARQARIETTYRPHNINALEFVRSVLFKNRRILHSVLVRTRRAVSIAWIRIPGRGRIRMIIRNLTSANYQVVREHAAHSLMETASDGFLRHLERSE